MQGGSLSKRHVLYRVHRRIKRSLDVRYALKAFKLLDAATRQDVIDDLKVYVSEGARPLVDSETEHVFRWRILTDPLFRTLFYARCRSRFEDIEELDFLIAKSEEHLPPDTQVDIHATQIGGGFRIYHGPIGIEKNVVIGRNVSVTAGLVLGKRGSKSPIIHDNVTIAANATVIGGIDVGENAVIGAGSVVLHDVPPNTVVAGNPARVLHQ